MSEPLTPLLDDGLAALPGIRHGFFTRQGGASTGIYDSLNTGLGSRDNVPLVKVNRARIQAHLGANAFLTVYQHHSAICVRTAVAWQTNAAPRADAIVTRTPGLAICAQAADCGPILFADPVAGVIGAAHAGWKGALNGVLEATVEAMEAEGATRPNIQAALGPSISRIAYEVGPEFVTQFTDKTPDNARYFTPSTRANHAMFDLPSFTLDRLAAAGIEARALGRCTYSEPELFYSYRRATHQGEPDYGRLASAIMLTHGR
ncbi:MAG: peptidoglycan editing factor PgeF [Devosiaceae bacterium]